MSTRAVPSPRRRGDLDIDGNLIIANNSTLDTENNTITIAGNWTNNNGTASAGFTEGTSTVTFNGAGGQTINQTGTTETFHHVNINTTGGTLALGGSTAFNARGNVTIADGSTLNPNYNLVVLIDNNSQLHG